MFKNKDDNSEAKNDVSKLNLDILSSFVESEKQDKKTKTLFAMATDKLKIKGIDNLFSNKYDGDLRKSVKRP